MKRIGRISLPRLKGCGHPWFTHDQYPYGFADVLKILETPRQCCMSMHGGAMQPGDASGGSMTTARHTARWAAAFVRTSARRLPPFLRIQHTRTRARTTHEPTPPVAQVCHGRVPPRPARELDHAREGE